MSARCIIKTVEDQLIPPAPIPYQNARINFIVKGQLISPASIPNQNAFINLTVKDKVL